MSILKILLVLLFAISQMAFLEPKHSTLDISQHIEGSKFQIIFKVIAHQGIKITNAAPWSLSIMNDEGLGLPMKKGHYKQSHDLFREDIPGFRIETKMPSKKNGKIHYKLRAFVCTYDKSRCFPEVHKGTFSWTKQ